MWRRETVPVRPSTRTRTPDADSGLRFCGRGRFGVAAIAFAIVAAPFMAQAQQAVEVALPAGLSHATDIRFDAEGSVLLSVLDRGVVRFDPKSGSTAVVRGVGKAGGLWVPSRLGADGDWIAVAAPINILDVFGWRQETGQWRFDFSGVEDIDLRGQEVVALGLRRDEKGRIAPDGAWLWRGKMNGPNAELRPAAFTTPSARSVGNCSVLGIGAVRFVGEDGHVLAAWGGDDLVRAFDASNRQVAQWSTEQLGVAVECAKMQEALRDRLSADPIARAEWLGERSFVEDVLPIGPYGTLLVREPDDRRATRWRLARLLAGGQVKVVPLPLVGPPRSHLRADVGPGGNEVTFLRFEDDARTRNFERATLIWWTPPAELR